MLAVVGGVGVVLGASACGGGAPVSTLPVGPARGLPKLPPSDAVVTAKEDGRLALALAVRPVGGQMETIATVLASDGTGRNGLEVSFRRGGETRPARPCGSGCYSARLPAAGPKAVTVLVSGKQLRFGLPERWPTPSAAALVRRATAAYRHLRSVAFVERLSSGPGRMVVSHWTEIAPDRFAYRIPKGASGIEIGSRRWDQASPGARWIGSTTQPIPMPAPIWGTSRITNAHVLGAGKVDGRPVTVVSLLNRSIPAWFTISFDRQLRPRTLDMTAPAHFMHHEYLSFNRPLKIRPPG
jgi:hypothetical protein